MLLKSIKIEWIGLVLVLIRFISLTLMLHSSFIHSIHSLRRDKIDCMREVTKG